MLGGVGLAVAVVGGIFWFCLKRTKDAPAKAAATAAAATSAGLFDLTQMDNLTNQYRALCDRLGVKYKELVAEMRAVHAEDAERMRLQSQILDALA